MDVHICCLAQLNRGGEETPSMSHIKDSSCLEQDASYIFLLKRSLEEQRTAQGPELKALDAAILIEKNRGGRTGVANLAFNAITTKFYDATFDHMNDNGGI